MRALTKRSSQQQFYFDTCDLKSARNIQGGMKESGDVILSGAKMYLDLGEALMPAGEPRHAADEIAPLAWDLAVQQSDTRRQSRAAQPDQSPRNSDQQHFANRVKDKSPLQIDRHRNKSTEKGVEKKRHRHEYHDVDQITPSTRSASSFCSLNLALRHSQEVITSANDRKTNLILSNVPWSNSSHVASQMKSGNHCRQTVECFR